jgi:crotonobetainyl-CoA:carnitine CoA-transferase CaiB-like acyl-CoA transferase
LQSLFPLLVQYTIHVIAALLERRQRSAENAVDQRDGSLQVHLAQNDAYEENNTESSFEPFSSNEHRLAAILSLFSTADQVIDTGWGTHS